LAVSNKQQSSIDEKIGTALLQFGWPGHTDIKDVIAQIKQAFADEGYLTPEQKEQTQKLVNQMAQTAQDMAKLPVTVREVGTMTGQEFYSRFEKELNNPDSPLPYPKHIDVLREHGLVTEAAQLESDHIIKVIKAIARRAAGITEAKDE
jgi:hypothetical protein